MEYVGFTESPADEVRRKRYNRLIDLVNKWMSEGDANQLEEWTRLKASIEEHRLSYRRRFSDKE